jgi:hypothetical protein
MAKSRAALPSLTPLAALLAAACAPYRDSEIPPPPPPPPVREVYISHPPEIATARATLSIPDRDTPLATLGQPVVLSPRSALPGDGVRWTPVSVARGVPAGLSPFLADIEAHLPRELGYQYRDRDHTTWSHETTHGIHSALRNRYGLAAFYPGGGRCALVEQPHMTLGDVAAAVPTRFRGSRFQLYLVQQRRDWEHDPLNIWDEWVAYNNGTTTGIEEGARNAGPSDDAIACLEMSGYALAVSAAARQRGTMLSPQGKEFLAWELRRSLALFARGVKMPGYAWPDRRLEQLWRSRDPFLVNELRVLYGDGLTIADLLP